jgi:hypothetical protein
MAYKDNWLQWNGDKLQFKKTVTWPIKSYYKELLSNAAGIRDAFSGPIDLFFSGGVSSQAILNTYIQLGIPVNVYIIKYNNNYNQYDYAVATKICSELGVSYTTIDINLEHFFENEAINIFNISQCIDTKKLILLKMLEKTDGTPIIGGKEPYIFRVNNKSHVEKSEWLLKITANDLVMDVYSNKINRQAVTNWFFWSPFVPVAMLNHPTVELLLTDIDPSKASLASSRGAIYKQYWPNIINRISQTGFENIKDEMMSLYPPCMIDFYLTNIHKIVKPVKPFTFTKELFVNNLLV